MAISLNFELFLSLKLKLFQLEPCSVSGLVSLNLSLHAFFFKKKSTVGLTFFLLLKATGSCLNYEETEDYLKNVDLHFLSSKG